MTIENEEFNEDSLFDGAVGDGPEIIPEEPKPEPEAPEPEAPLTTEGEKPAVDDNAPHVPSWRLREINDERRATAAENERLKAELAQMRQVPREQPRPAEKPARPDPLLDPDGYAQAIRQELREEALNERREESLVRARESNQAEFDEAYAAAQKAVDPALKARMHASRDPGKTLLEWHRETKARAEVGTDLNAYKAKLREEALKDPEFRKAAMETWRASASTETNGRPNVQLAPSMSSLSRSSAAARASNDDMSDDALWEQTTA